MIKWKRPSGSIIETRDGEEIIISAKSWGWVRVDELKTENDALRDMTEKEEIASYVLEETGIELDKRGGIDKVKEKARLLLDGN